MRERDGCEGDNDAEGRQWVVVAVVMRGSDSDDK